MKKFFSAVFAVILTALTLTACSGAPELTESPLTVNGTPLDGEIFMYYLDRAFSEAEEQTRDGRVGYATNMCIRYVATNSTFAQKNLVLTPSETVALSEEANALWSLFGAHYTALGISKETFMKIRTNAAYTEKLRFSLYDADGTTPIPDEVLKQYLAAEYVAFKLVRGYLFATDVYGNTVEYSEQELTAILDRYNLAEEQINDGTSIEFVYPSLVSGAQETEQTLKTVVIADADPYYPEGFYAQVRAIEPNKAAVCVFGDYLYLVYRVDVLADEQVFKDNREACLKAVSEIPLQNEISRMCSAYTSVRRPKLVNEYYTEILKEKGEKKE